jgi:hypothetical protein
MDNNKHLTKPVELPGQKPTNIRTSECFIELFDDCLHWKMDFDADEPIDDNDLTLGIESIRNSIDVWVDKFSISAIEKSFKDNKKWAVYIIVIGMATDIVTYYNSETSATILYDRLIKWKFNK